MAEKGLGKLKSYPLSDADIRRILGSGIKIITYPDLNKMSDISQAFDKKGRCIMLYLTENSSTGHWTCMLNKPSGIEFFDPYGNPPDYVLQELPMEQREELGEAQPILTELLKASGKPVYYNSYGFQKDKADVNTCGRHSVVRCLYDTKSLDEYKKIMDTSGMSPDNFVSALTANSIKK